MDFEKEFERLAEGELPSEEITTPVDVDPEPIEPEVEPAPIIETPLNPEPEVAPAIDWEHKYNTLNGMYKHDLAELRNEVARLKEKPVEEPVVEKPSNKVIDDFWDLYPDLKEPLIAIINNVVESRIGEVVDTHIKPIESSVQKSAEERFIEDIERVHPDWRVVLDSDGFNGWVSGLPVYQQQGVNSILQSGTPSQVNDLLSEYKSMAKAPKPQPQIPLTPATPQVDPRIEKMRALAAVDSTPPAPPQPEPEKSFEEFFEEMCSK